MNGGRRDIMGEPLRAGDRVVSAYPFCGTCYYCAVANQPTLCPHSARYGRESCETHPYLLGGCSEYHYLSPQSEIVRVPEEVPSPLAASAACALRTVMHGFERLGGIASHEAVVVQGCGPVGLYATAVARDRGASTVLVVGAPAGRLDVAKAWGADDVLDLDEHLDVADRRSWVLKHTDGRGPDIVIQCAGGRAIEEGLDFIRPGGRYVSIGGGGGPLTVNGANLSGKNLQIIGIRSGQGRHYHQALQFLATRQHIPFDRLLSGTYSLDGISDALQAMADFREIKPIIHASHYTLSVEHYATSQKRRSEAMTTTPVDLETIIDGDGHIFEDEAGVLKFMPPEYQEQLTGASRGVPRLFPPLDHIYSSRIVKLPPKSFQQTRRSSTRRLAWLTGRLQ